MFEGLKEALQYVNKLKEESMQPIVTEIAGKTYCNKDLERYGMEDMARAIHVNTLSAMVDYITGKKEELRKKMILHIRNIKKTLKMLCVISKIMAGHRDRLPTE